MTLRLFDKQSNYTDKNIDEEHHSLASSLIAFIAGSRENLNWIVKGWRKALSNFSYNSCRQIWKTRSKNTKVLLC